VTDLAALRRRLHLTQAAFAQAYGLSRRTVQEWEAGRREPEGSARTLLLLIEREPETIARILAT
jgi:putative transcriptional regulator